ncbi:hypothetical protein AURDEDRAFT_102357 [Auricularia subglabra TFB-10046 SS5]|nr:hypothetical protein AURDEDRAFT_102357 [Auricularia subglabra TFB-10046 SS5]
MKKSVETKNPVRVIRGYRLQSEWAPASGYRYDGLYRVEKAWMEQGLNQGGFQVCKFALKRIDGQPPLRRRDPCAVAPSAAQALDSAVDTANGENDEEEAMSVDSPLTMIDSDEDTDAMDAAMPAEKIVQAGGNDAEPTPGDTPDMPIDVDAVQPPDTADQNVVMVSTEVNSEPPSLTSAVGDAATPEVVAGLSHEIMGEHTPVDAAMDAWAFDTTAGPRPIYVAAGTPAAEKLDVSEDHSAAGNTYSSTMGTHVMSLAVHSVDTRELHALGKAVVETMPSSPADGACGSAELGAGVSAEANVATTAMAVACAVTCAEAEGPKIATGAEGSSAAVPSVWSSAIPLSPSLADPNREPQPYCRMLW